MKIKNNALKELTNLVKNENGNIYVVGGYVRDHLLKIESKDIDVVINNISKETLESILSTFGNVDYVGKSFGVYNINNEVQVALPRTERSTGSGHTEFDIKTDPFLPIEEDLKRRDFTINAIAYDLIKKEYIDIFNSKEDLRNGILKPTYLGTFKDDPLRMLRAIKFISRLGFKLENRQMIEQNRELIKTVSKERVIKELTEIMLGDNVAVALIAMFQTGLMEIVLPEVDLTYSEPQNWTYHNKDVFTHTIAIVDNIESDLVLRLSALFHDTGKTKTKTIGTDGLIHHYEHELQSKLIAEERLSILGFPNKIVSDVVVLVANHMKLRVFSKRLIKRLKNKIGDELTKKLIKLIIADKEQSKYPITQENIQILIDMYEEAIDEPFSRNHLFINGFDIMKKYKIESGKEIGELLSKLTEYIIKYPEKNNKEDLLIKLKEMKEK